MTVKCFKTGAKAFILGDGRIKPQLSNTVAVPVVKVGRRYVTVLSNGQELRFCEPCNHEPYFVEDKDWGVPRLLFSTVGAAARYREREELKVWVAEETGWLKMERYSLEQLRQVKRILERVRPENGPLDLFELEGMVGERVWVERTGARDYGNYAVVEGVDFIKYVLFLKGGACYNYGEVWFAYRTKPEEEQHDD